MIRTGVTGGIGSGKSTVCEQWRKSGAFVVDSDLLAKELMVQNIELKEQIISVFGKESYHRDQTLNREYLASAAFGQGRVGELNRLVHPKLRDEIVRLMEKAESDGYPMFVQEAAILLNNGRPEQFDYIVLVRAEQKRRMEWVSKRDTVPKAQIEERMGVQKSDEELLPYCDYVIENNSTLPELTRQADELYKTILRRGKRSAQI